MKYAFTLIELLVVIAIIAILAAILFPVFAQAKVAAKKSVAISNAKQQGLGLVMYVGDYEDTYPRNDDCVLNSSLNPKFRAASYNTSAGVGCTGPYYNRLNNFSWQKWIMPYVKNTEVFFDPLRNKDETTWNNDGELFNQFLLNNGLTGSLYVDTRTGKVLSRGKRNPWYGGVLSAIPRPSEAMILMEVSYNIGTIPAATDDSQYNSSTQDIVAYPIAFREYWRNKVNKTPRGVIDCYLGTVSDEVDNNKAITGGLTMGFSDGSAKFMKAGAFLAKCPTKLELVHTSSSSVAAGYTYQNDCHGTPNTTLNAGNLGIVHPDTSIDYPFWGFGN